MLFLNGEQGLEKKRRGGCLRGRVQMEEERF